MTTVDKQIERAKELLAAHGFKLEIDGCGCCGSPNVRLEHGDELVIGDEVANGYPRSSRSEVIFSMFEVWE